MEFQLFLVSIVEGSKGEGTGMPFGLPPKRPRPAKAPWREGLGGSETEGQRVGKGQAKDRGRHLDGGQVPWVTLQEG